MTNARAESAVGRDKQTLLILGATGDLTARLLLPGLAGLLAAGSGGGLSLVGTGTKAQPPAIARDAPRTVRVR